MKTGGPITIAIDSHKIFFVNFKAATQSGCDFIHPQELLGPGCKEQLMPVLKFFWHVGFGADFSLS